MILSLARLAVVALLLAAATLADAANLLMIEHDVSVDQGFGGMLSDRFTWIDVSGQPRVGVLAHNDGQTGPGGSRGGELREFRYQTPGGGRIVRASGSGAAGFGYVVSHPKEDEETCVAGPDSSSLGHFTSGAFTRVFEGRHHAIFRFTQAYPRYCTTGGAAENDLPVTIDWVFSTGWDNPLWAVTWDLSSVAAGVLKDDSRGPYGELLFDGSMSEDAHSFVAGVAWGERYKFTASSATGVTYNSDWDWSALNSIPYVKLWTDPGTAVDATMGTVQTQTMHQQDAGGYFGFPAWGSNSVAFGNACVMADGGDADALMPCDFNWPYQSINYSMGTPNGGDENTPTKNTRLAWGTNFGFLGQTQYPVMGSNDPSIGGPVGDGVDPNFGSEPKYASGHPKKSYSTFVVLGRHTDAPVETQVTQIERVQTTTLTATVGSVLTTGAAGVNRTDTVTYAPAGWNHVYAAWALQAAGNHIDANFNVSATLTNPLVIVSNWTAGTLPASVKFNGATLTQDTDYFPSLRADANELWITLNRNLSVATNPNRLEIAPPLFTLTVVDTGTGSGTVGSQPVGISCGADCTEQFEAGTVVMLTATAAGGSFFAGWSGGGCGGVAPCTVTVTADTTVNAAFDPIPPGTVVLTVTKSGTGVGTVTSVPPGIQCGADCAEPFPSGTPVTLTAVAAPGSFFTGWSGAGCSGTGTCNVATVQPVSVAAGFSAVPANFLTASLNQSLFTVSSTLRGSVGANNPGLPATVDFYLGVLLPDGDTIVFITPVGFTFGRLFSLGTAPAFVAGVSLAPPFNVSEPDILTYTWTGGEPRGHYLFFVAAVTAGAFLDGRLDPGDLIGLATAGFTF